VVGEDEVLRRRVPAGQRGLELLEVRRLADAEHRLEIGRRDVAHPVHRGGLAVLGHDRAVHGDVHGQVHRGLAAHRNVVVHHGHRVPRAIPVVVVAAGALGVELGALVLRVGQAPRDVLVVTEQDAGQGRDADAGHVVAGRGACDLVPDRRQRLRQVRVARQQRGLPVAGRPRVAVRVFVEVAKRQVADLGEQCAGGLSFLSIGGVGGGGGGGGGGGAGGVGGQGGQAFVPVRAGVVGGLGVLGDDREPVHRALGAERTLEQ